MSNKNTTLYKPSEFKESIPVLTLHNQDDSGLMFISPVQLKAIETILGLMVDVDNKVIYTYTDDFISKLTKTVKHKAKRMQKSLKKQTR